MNNEPTAPESTKRERRNKATASTARPLRAVGPDEAQSTDGTPKTAKHTDLWRAEYFANENREKLRYCYEWLLWVLWNGKRWEIDTKAGTHAQSLGCETSRKIYGEADGETDIKRSAQGQSRGKIGAMIALATSNPMLAASKDCFDQHPLLFNTDNGTIDLSTNAFRPHAQGDLLTQISGVAYDEHAECPQWLAFLDRVFAGNQALIAFVQRMFGYCLTGSVEHQVMFFLYGGGANGKSVLLKVLASLLGEYAEKAPPKLLYENNEHATELTTLYGKRAAMCAEVPKGHAFDEGKVKDLTGGEKITSRRMNENWWSFTPTHKLVLAGNHKPEISGGDDGIWRRMMLVPFNVQIPKEERDPALFEKLQTELSGILNWAIAGWLDCQANGLQPPHEVLSATQEYRDESDPIADFLASRCAFEQGAKMPRAWLMTAYKEFCEENGMKRLSHHEFLSRLFARGVPKEPKTTMRIPNKITPVDAWQNIRLKTEREREGLFEESECNSRNSESMNESENEMW